MGKRAHFKGVLSSSAFKATRGKKATLAASAFDVIRSKPHHSALNQSQRGQVKSQALANERSISRRKESLLLELTQRERQNAFVDKRIGENEPRQEQGDRAGRGGVAREEQQGVRDVMAERFVKERLRKLRKGRTFNLEEGTGEEEELTHAGQALSTVHYTPREAEDDGEGNDRQAGRIDASQVHALHFGGGTSDPYAIRAAMGRGGVEAVAAATPSAARSKKEVMDEIILKSKMYKAEKAEEVAAQATRVDGLDTDFSQIRALLDFKDAHEPAAADAVVALDDDDFVRQSRMLAEEGKVKAAERVKTPEEQAKEQRERMERLERARLRRMRGEEDVDEEENAADHGIGSRRKRRREAEKAERREEEERGKKAKGSAAATPNPTDDDLVDNFIVDKDTRRRQQREEEEDEEDGEEEEEEGGEGGGEADPSVDDDEQEDDEDDEADGAALSADEEEADSNDASPLTPRLAKRSQAHGDGSTKEEQLGAAAAASKKARAASVEDEVPFVFPYPTSHRHLVALLAPYPSPLHPLIYRRLHSYHFLALTSANRGHMETFITAALTHFHTLCKRHSPSTATFTSLLAHLDPLTSILSDLSQLLPAHTAAASRQLLSTLPTSSSSPADLLTAKLLFDLFPSSDARHNVTTPLFIHLAGTLHFAPLRSTPDLTRALFTCQLLLHATQQSKRYIPELLNTLYGTLLKGWGVDVKEGVKPEVDGLRPLHSKLFTDAIRVWHTAGERLGQGTEVADEGGWRVDLQAMFMKGEEGEALLSSSAFLCSLFALTLRLVGQASRVYEQLPSYPELFTPFHAALTVIDRLHSSTLPPSLTTLLRSTLSSLSHRLRSPRPSFLRPPAPPSIRLHTPAYVEGYQPGKDYDPVKERAEMRELGRKMRREKRGAEKEVRKDAEFVRQEQARVREAVEAARQEKRRQNFRDMEEQARDSNLLHKPSKKKKEQSS